jgi:3-oxoacyl-[acyl-carrier-protein] synthase III
MYINRINWFVGNQKIKVSEMYSDENISQKIEKTGIENVYRFSKDTDLAQEISNFIQKSDFDLENITGILAGTNQSTHLIQLPCLAARIAHNLKIGNVRTQTVAEGCSASVQVLQTAFEVCNSAKIAQKKIKMLLVLGDHTSRIITPEDIGSNILFSDGVVVVEVTNYKTLESMYETVSAESSSFSGHSDFYSMTKRIDTWFQMQGLKVYKFACTILPHIENLLGKNFQEGDIIIPHQPNVAILKSIQENTSAKVFMEAIKEIGNISPGATLHALKRAHETLDMKSYKRIFLIGFGIGLKYGVCEIRKV